ncbi:DUF1848 domain-containing protein [Desulfocurvus sp. DL9XJH121]
MIISASRRTDIPAFYARWFMNRLRQGWCAVPSPYAHARVARVSLRPQDVDALVFWTRNPLPMLPFLDELKQDFKFYFQVTLLDEPRALAPRCPDAASGLEAILRLSRAVGPERVVWRYDPICLCRATDAAHHLAAFDGLSRRLAGRVRHCVISFFAPYVKAVRRIVGLGVPELLPEPLPCAAMSSLAGRLAELASARGMALEWCCPPRGAALPPGVSRGACIDPEILADLGAPAPSGTDRGQRPGCGCAPSRDVGMYDSCVHGCAYCYATSSPGRARANFAAHDPLSPSLVGRHLPDQGSLFDL